MRILLVRPRPDPETIGLQHVMLVEPMELEVLAATLGPDDAVEVRDMVLERQPLEHFLARFSPDVLGVTGYITNVPAMIDYCRRAKAWNPALTTVVGGVHCEVCPGDLDDASVDYRVVRNPVAAFPALLRHVTGDGERPPGVFGPGEDVDRDALPPFDWSYPLPRRELSRRYRHRYFYIFHDKVALLKTAFGCPFTCTFCFCREITGHAYQRRPLTEVMRDLTRIDEREVYIVDDDFLVNRHQVEEFLDAVGSYGIDKHYLVYGRADFIARNADLMERLREAGLRTVIVGFESFDDDELDGFDKGIDAATNREAMTVLNRLKIECYATVILSPDWGHEEFAALDRNIRELGIRFINLQPLTPLPGTGMEVPDDQLVIPRDDFARWDLAHVTVRPTKLSVEEYYGKIIESYTRALYRPGPLVSYLRYPPGMLRKMISGNAKVYRQYVKKKKEARHLA